MVQLRKKAIKSYLEQNTKSSDVSNKLFWKTIRSFFSNKGTHDNHDIILEENGDLIKDKENISDILNDFCINIVEKATSRKPFILNSILNIEPYGTCLYEQSYHPQSNYSTRRPLNLFVPRVNQTTYGLHSFRYQGTLLWNSLPEEIKTAANLNTFKKLIKNWSGPACKCNFCTYHREEI